MRGGLVTASVRATLDVVHAGCALAQGTQLHRHLCDNEKTLQRSISLIAGFSNSV